MQPYTRQQNIALVTWEHVLNKQRYQILLNATIYKRTKHCSGYIRAGPKQQRYQILLNATIN